MKYTNTHNIPQRIIKLLSEERQPVKDRISVTQLIDAPRIRTLLLTKWDEIVLDYSDFLYSVIGLSVDERSGKRVEDDTQAQVKLETKVDGLTVVGRADLINENTNTIIDTKVCGTNTLDFSDTLEKWEAQLNCYAWLYTKSGKIVKALSIDCWFRDWKLSKAKYDVEYPQLMYQELKMPLWTFEQQEQYIKDQIEYHTISPMDCPDTYRWKTADCYAVMPKGGKKAIAANKYINDEKIPFSLADAQKYIAEHNLMNKLENGSVCIEHREGVCIRCLDYCKVRSVCEFTR